MIVLTEKDIEDVIKKIRETAVLLEPPFRMIDFPDAKTAVNIFGTWNEALRAAGLMHKSPITGYESCYSDEYLKKKFEAKVAELGRVPTGKEFQPLNQICIKKYGTWKNAISFFGYDIKETLEKELMNFYKKYGRAPMKSEMQNGTLIVKELGHGSYTQALRSVGLPVSSNAHLSDEELLELMQEAGRKLGRPPRAVDMPQSTTILRRFGKWNKALELAGFETWQKTHDSKIDIPDSQLLSDIQVLILSKNGESPYYREYDHAGVCVKRFGKWSTAVEKAREDPYNTMEFAKEIWGKMQITY